jgi:nitroimidazol reductase NimA-like FMN-containing flavoprotein (pyridoxamine 5'-phosphate oxidase superfamily)
MDAYHMRRAELAMESEDEMLKVLRGQRYLTLAMCNDDKPYLVTLNYAFDQPLKCFYFHCARGGRKIDILSANPFVWGQVVEDLGYIEGECEYGYRSVMFEGRVTFLDDLSEKRKALEAMIETYEHDAEKAKKQMIEQSSLEKVCIGRIQVLSMSGKESLPKKK